MPPSRHNKYGYSAKNTPPEGVSGGANRFWIRICFLLSDKFLGRRLRTVGVTGAFYDEAMHISWNNTAAGNDSSSPAYGL